MALLRGNWHVIPRTCIHSEDGQWTKLLPKPALHTGGIYGQLCAVHFSAVRNTCSYLPKLSFRKAAFRFGSAYKSCFRIFDGRCCKLSNLIPGERPCPLLPPN